MVIPEITAGLSGLKAALDLAKGLNSTLNAAAIADVKIGLQSSILDAQQALFAAQQNETATARQIADLEQEIVRLKDWSQERANYELKAVDDVGFAYMKKPGMEGGEPPHWLCASCFGDGKKSILQSQGQSRGGRPADHEWRCTTCKGTMVVHFRTSPSGR